MTDLRDISLPTDPDEALAAVVALRRLADRVERETVRSALRQGWSWSRIAQALGITKQAAHKRLSDVIARDNSK